MDRTGKPECLSITQKLSRKKRKLFLSTLIRTGGQMTKAAQAAGYRDSGPIRTMMRRDPAFRALSRQVETLHLTRSRPPGAPRLR